MRKDISKRYLNYLINLVCGDEQHKKYYSRLYEFLHSVEFTWSIRNDENRAVDGIDMRSRFADECGYSYGEIRPYLMQNCTVLEMMVGLACRCEDSIMGDEQYGDRTPKWFWVMVRSMGLLKMDDGRFDGDLVNFQVTQMLCRHYACDGNGGLFYVRGCQKDLRKEEIWYQMCAYLDTIVSYDDDLEEEN